MKQDSVYWHLQMHLPEGKGGIVINPIDILNDGLIATGEWDDLQCANFKNVKNGSIVLVRQGQEAIALCQIIGNIFTDINLTKKYINTNFRRIRILDWANNYEQPRPKLFSQGTFKSCRYGTEQYEYIDSWYNYINKMEKIKQYTQILSLKKNLILQGAPGTGKTYNTAALALSICGEPVPEKHEDVMKRYDELQKEGRIGFVTFHQSMDYEDFVEGIKPKTENGTITYEVEDGIFKEISDRAQENDDRNHVLIIDEINRGNVSKIFGDLITLLEADKRIDGAHPIKVTLPYSKEEFGVPSNLYIIGTMNTTDRSVGNIDYAVRRRFAFVTLKADRQILVGKYGEDSKQVQLFDMVSDFLNDDKKHVDMDFEDLMVGHSYFMADDSEELKLKLEYEIIPLIEEYQKDGIINVKKEELEKEFENWKGIIEA